MKINKKAFTLLEILVVIGIIAVLVGLTTSSYSIAQKKARDAKRKSDLKSVQNCLEQYYSYNDNFKYDGGSLVNGNLPTSLSCGGTVYLTSPVDPINDITHKYVVSGVSSSGYKITAALEQGGTFEVTNQQ